VVTADDVSEPVKLSDDAAEAEMSELDNCNADSLSSVIGLDSTSVVSVVETSTHPPIDDNSIIAPTVNDMVECHAAEAGTGSVSEHISSSPSKLVIDTLSDAGDDCDVQKALEAENLETVDTDTIAVCETVDETGCDPVINALLPQSSDVPVTFPIPPTDVGEITSGDDIIDPGDMQLDIAECVEVSDIAD